MLQAECDASPGTSTQSFKGVVVDRRDRAGRHWRLVGGWRSRAWRRR